MSGTKHIFIINPVAGKRDRTTEQASLIAASAERCGIEHEIFITNAPKHAISLVRDAVIKHHGQDLRFYACGGDGTLNEVANAAVVFPNCAITNFPSGSGNDFIKIFGQNSSSFLELEKLIVGQTVELDYIQSGNGISINILSVGLDARIAAGTSKFKIVPGMTGKQMYFASTAEQVLKGLHKNYRVEVDGVNYDGRFTMIVAANGGTYGGSFDIIPDPQPCDGYIDVLLVGPVSRFTVARVIGLYKSGKYAQVPHIIKYIRAKNLKVQAADRNPIKLNLDGETSETGIVDATISDKKMRFIVPKGVLNHCKWFKK